MEGARVHAESAIREKNQSQMYLRLSSRLTAVNSRIETAIRLNQVTKSMKGVVNCMEEMQKANMDVVKMSGILDKFEQQFQDMDVLDKSMSSAFDSTMATTTPETDVESLMSQVADEHGLEFQSELDGIGTVRKKEQVDVAAPAEKQTIAIGGGGNNNKKGGNDAPAAAPAASTSSGGAPSLDDLEARLRNL